MSAVHNRTRTRQQQKVEELCAAIIRSLSGEADVRYRAGRLRKGQRALPVHAAHLQPDHERDDFPSFRGTADSIALRLQYSDPVTHRQYCPTQAIERLIRLRLDGHLLVPGDQSVVQSD